MTSSAIDFNVSGIEFVAAVLLAATVFFWLPTARLRQLLWACGNLFVLWLVLPNASSLATSTALLFRGKLGLFDLLSQQASAAALAVFLLSGYVVARALQRWPSGWLLSGYAAVLVAAFLVLKQYALLDWLLPPSFMQSALSRLGIPIQDAALVHLIRILGLSYMLFRQIHVLVDAAQGQIERISLWSYLNYQINVFTLLAGPIQRFQEFEEQWRTLQPVLADLNELLSNCLRILLGVLKIALIAPLFYKGWDELQVGMVNMHVSGWRFLVQFPIVFYFYPIYLYFNFAGYCDIVIAASRMFGMNLPENFNQPYLARNVLDFWTRWHITLGLWIRDYLFLPMYKPVVERWPKRAPSLAFVFYFLAFLIAGAWHGGTVNFLIYGGLQGLGASAAKIYENAIIAARGRNALKQYMKSPSWRAAAIFLNFHFQCFTLLFFSQVNCKDSWAMLRGLAAAITAYKG
jgi:D-alanyl-lipoteichoic acid acyltransferase DltB (MBOAT superfamily)